MEVDAERRHPLLGVRIVTNEQQQPQLLSQGVPVILLEVIERQDEQHWCEVKSNSVIADRSLGYDLLIEAQNV